MAKPDFFAGSGQQGEKISLARYTSTDERGGVSSAFISRSASKNVNTTGFYSVPDENTDMYLAERDDEVEPFLLGEILPDGVKKADGGILQQGERLMTNEARTANVHFDKNGNVVITKFELPFRLSKRDKNGKYKVVSSNTTSPYFKVNMSKEFSIESGVATLNGKNITYTPNGSIKMDNNGIISLN